MTLKILNSKEKKEIISILKSQFDYDVKNSNLEFHIIKDEEKVYFFTSDETIDFSRLKIKQIGTHIGDLNDGRLILTIQGAQIIGPFCSKNIIEFSKENARRYLKGEDIDTEQNDGVYLLKCDDDFIGCGIVRSGTILNTIERARRINCKD